MERRRDAGTITLREVAARAGVTPTVVSHVLHDRAKSIRVSEATAERVREAAKDLGYRLNMVARNLRERQTLMLGVLHGLGFGRPRFQGGPGYFAALMDGLIDGAFAHGYALTLCPRLLGQSPEDAMTDGRFDGLIWYSTSPSGENREMLMRCSVPLVLIHTPAAEFEGRFATVICDNMQGIGLGVEHLFQLGHRKIAFALERDDLFGEVTRRRDAFFYHMRAFGLSVSEDDVIDVLLDRSGVHAYLKEGLRHTAVIGVNDGVAAAFLEHAPSYGIRVPDDFSVVGFDSTDFCAGTEPALTSISQPLVMLGHRAVDLLAQTIAGPPPDPSELILPCGLDVRGSTTSVNAR